MMSDKPLWTDERIRGPWVRSMYGFQILTRSGYSVCELKSVGNESMQIAIADMIARAPILQAALDAANARVATLEKIVTDLEQQCHSLAADLTADLAGSDAAWDIMSDMMGMEDDDE